MKNCVFQSMSEIELFELKNPGVLTTNSKANKAAGRFVESQLKHANGGLQ